MRLHFRLSPNDRPVPWEYLQNLAGWLHDRLGERTDLHEGTSLYSMSNLSNGRIIRGKLDFEGGSSFFLSSYHDSILVELMSNLLSRKGHPSQRDPRRIAWDMYVEEVNIEHTPDFAETATFWAKSPVLLREAREDGTREHVLFNDDKADSLLTRVLHWKQKKAGLEPAGIMRFDRSYDKAKSKLVTYSKRLSKGEKIEIKNRASLCPIVVEGGKDVCAFAWNTGAGQSTGIGFGALEMQAS